MKLLLTAFYALSLTNSSASTRISNGDLVAGSDPYTHNQVFLLSQNKSGLFLTCGGTVISESCILTAKHCTENIIESSIGFGRNLNNLPNDRIIEADKFVGHPVADITILKFSGGLPHGYAPAFLGERNLTLDLGSPVTAYGYSSRKPGGSDFGVLRKFVTTLKAMTSESLDVPGPTTEKMASTYKGLNHGDSGSALTAIASDGGQRIIGVNSGLIFTKAIGRDVRIQKYLPWLKAQCRIKI